MRRRDRRGELRRSCLWNGVLLGLVLDADNVLGELVVVVGIVVLPTADPATVRVALLTEVAAVHGDAATAAWRVRGGVGRGRHDRSHGR